jgi:hypothetical protein
VVDRVRLYDARIEVGVESRPQLLNTKRLIQLIWVLWILTLKLLPLLAEVEPLVHGFARVILRI